MLYALIDFFDPSISGQLERIFQYSRLQIYNFFQENWSVKDAVEGVVLFERKSNPLRLVEVSREPFLKSPPALNARIDHAVVCYKRRRFKSK